jgi:hypothetical protein
MKRIVDTSRGRVVLDFYDGTLGASLVDECGWETDEGELGDKQVAQLLIELAGIPPEEAEEIEREVLQEYRARGGSPETRIGMRPEREPLAYRWLCP